MPSAFDPTANGQIMARTAPKLVDLFAALATGLAGAFAIGRKDVSDTLPGVAIAISLVPPLANVGILLGAGRTDLASGSMLLFITNYFAILLTGSFVFGLMGYPQAALEGKAPRIKHIAIAVVIVMVVVIMVPLGFTSLKVWGTNVAQSNATAQTKAWLEGSDYRFVSATVEDGRASVVVAGSGRLPKQADLERRLKGKVLGLPVRVEAVPSMAFGFETK